MTTRPPTVRRSMRLAAAVITAAAVSFGALSVPADASSNSRSNKPTKLAQQLVKKSTVGGANRHLIALQRIADSNGGNRASNTPGYAASASYVADKLRAAGFKVSTPSFTYPEDVVDAEQLVVGEATYAILAMDGTPQTPVGGVTGRLVVVPQDATSGCEASDFVGLAMTGGVALIRRGGCTFALKQANAAAAGAIAAVVANNVDGPLANVTLGEGAAIPTGGVSKADGDLLFGRDGSAATIDLRSHVEERTSTNVIAQTRTGRANNVVMAGAHLDSVEVGPGINDNGSGSAALLELALKMGSKPKVSNSVRFAWWGSEELGLIGSTKYVQSLTFEQQLDIALYLNFDMVASPNAAYFVYDGDDSDGVGAGAGPNGSAQIERTFTDFFDTRLGVPTEGTDFSGRSDYSEFIAVGIPAGGLFTGAEEIKTAEQAAKWGGTAGVAFDPCYHAACDTLGHVNRVALDRNLDAIAWSVGVYAYSTEAVNGVPPRAKRAKQRATAAKKIRIADFVPGQRAA